MKLAGQSIGALLQTLPAPCTRAGEDLTAAVMPYAEQHPAGLSATGVDEVARRFLRGLSPPDPSYPRSGCLPRREFLRLSLVSVAAATIGLTSCDVEVIAEILDRILNRPVRRDLGTLDNDDPIVETYREAVTAMRGLSSADGRNWDNQARIHLDHCPHENWLFLPWHRAYLWYFEEICRELTNDDSFALPFWNWTFDVRVPPQFWGSGNPLTHPRGVTASSTPNDPTVWTPAYIKDPILIESNFLSFASGAVALSASQRQRVRGDPLERGPHDATHIWVGRGGFDMTTFLSARDPIFWAHHNMVECLWVEWNMTRGNPNTNDPAWVDRAFNEFSDRQGNPITVSVAELLLHPLFNYRYEDTRLGAIR